MVTYKDYLQVPKHLTFSEMVKIHENIAEEAGTDPEALGIYQELIKKSTEYANIRAKWPLLSRTKKLEQDPGKTSCHDSLIIKYNILSRYLRMQGKPASWRDILGEGYDDPYDRKCIGNLASKR